MFRYLQVLILCVVILQVGCLPFLKNNPNSQMKNPPVETVADTTTAETQEVPTPEIPTATPQLTFSKPDPEPSPTPSPKPEPTSVKPAPSDDEFVQMNFEDASLREILVYLAELAGWDYLISPEVGSGSVTLRTSKPFHRSDVEKVLYSILDMNNLAVVDGPVTREGKPAFKKIIPKPDAKHSPILTRTGKDLAGIPQEDMLVTQIITTEFVSPDEILETIRPLISPDATIITHPGANMMIITEISSNIRRIMQLIDLLDKETALLELEIFQIQFADVQDIVSVLERVLDERVSLGGSVASGGKTARGKTRRTSNKRSGSSKDMGPVIIPDTRSNSLIIFALRKDLDFIREIISILDVDIYVNKKAYIYYVENAIAGDLAKLLEAVYSGEDRTRSTRPATRRTSSRSSAGKGAIGGASEIQGEVSIVADERTNALIIVTAPVNYPYIVDTIKKLDIMPKQVLIEVLIADVTLDESSEMGISWDLRGEGSVDVGGDSYNFDGLLSQTVGGPASGMVYEVFEASRFKALVSAKANENKLEILSSPHILVANNMEASIDVGSDIPIVTSETDDGVDSTGRRQYNRTIEYRSTGILLRVTPHINSASFVNLDISQEVSSISETALESINSPVIEKRKADTTVMIQNNQTLVIGGLIQRSKNPAREGVPWLYRIPVLKYFFGKHKYSERASELLIFLTPRVISNPQQADVLSEQMKNKINIDESFYKEFLDDQTSRGGRVIQ